MSKCRGFEDETNGLTNELTNKQTQLLSFAQAKLKIRPPAILGVYLPNPMRTQNRRSLSSLNASSVLKKSKSVEEVQVS